MDTLTGKIVVTSDHGEMLGEREFPIPIRRYGHPSGVYIDALIDIPWLVSTYDERKEIISEKPRKDEEYEQEQIEDHLKNLGYKV